MQAKTSFRQRHWGTTNEQEGGGHHVGSGDGDNDLVNSIAWLCNDVCVAQETMVLIEYGILPEQMITSARSD